MIRDIGATSACENYSRIGMHECMKNLDHCNGLGRFCGAVSRQLISWTEGVA